MKILVTGSGGFVGKNLVENLKNIRDGKNRTRPALSITEIFEYDVNTEESVLEEACEKCDFVFHLAGVNRPAETEEKARSEAYRKGNYGFSGKLLDTLKKYNNSCPVMMSSSIQASLTGRFAGSEYGRSKLDGEKLFFDYGRDTGAEVLVYRFPNLFGKWCRPNYNSAVATFCYGAANNESYTIHDPSTELELLYIDDLIEELFDALEGKAHHCEYQGTEAIPEASGRYCFAPVTHVVTLGEIGELLEKFKAMPDKLLMEEIPEKSFAKKLYSTYLSYLPSGSIAYDLHMNVDHRGIFTELIKTEKCGQVSVNIARPGNVRGEHWHNSKWEIFIVVSGHGLIEERKIGKDEKGKPYPVHSFEGSGEKLKAVQMLPGYAHRIQNLSETENLVTVMWANEAFDAEHPDTFFERVELGEEICGSERKR